MSIQKFHFRYQRQRPKWQILKNLHIWHHVIIFMNKFLGKIGKYYADEILMRSLINIIRFFSCTKSRNVAGLILCYLISNKQYSRKKLVRIRQNWWPNANLCNKLKFLNTKDATTLHLVRHSILLNGVANRTNQLDWKKAKKIYAEIFLTTSLWTKTTAVVTCTVAPSIIGESRWKWKVR